MADRLWVLGSAGWMPSAGNETSCFLVELGDELVMLDAGTGVANLGLASEALKRHDRVHVLLSHYHLDHVVGLMYLKRFFDDKRVDVYGPGIPVYPRSTASYIADLLQDTLYSAGSEGFAREVRFHDYAGQDFRVGDVPVTVRPQQGAAPRMLAARERRPSPHERGDSGPRPGNRPLRTYAAHTPQPRMGRGNPRRGRAHRKASRHGTRSRRHGHRLVTRWSSVF